MGVRVRVWGRVGVGVGVGFRVRPKGRVSRAYARHAATLEGITLAALGPREDSLVRVRVRVRARVRVRDRVRFAKTASLG